MESFEYKIEKIYLEKKCEGNFDDRLSRLRNSEISRETEGLSGADGIRSKYKTLAIQRALEQGISLRELKEMPKDLKEEMNRELELVDEKYTIEGVHFLKCQFSKIIDDLRKGKTVEYEAFGPYLRDYINNGLFGEEFEFTKTDQIGLAIMEFLSKEIMPEARPVSLYDEYNMWMTSSDKLGLPKDRDNTNSDYSANAERGSLEVSDSFRERFKLFVEKAFRDRGIIKEGEEEGPENDFVLISESEKIKDAQELVKTLEAQGLIEYGEGEEIWFQNSLEKCEDPRHLRINLRNKDGKWQCAALDASGFLNERNRSITHLVILPKENFEEQQDQVWEILHSLGFQPENYHNIFFETENPEVTPESVIKTLRSQIGLLLN